MIFCNHPKDIKDRRTESAAEQFGAYETALTLFSLQVKLIALLSFFLCLVFVLRMF